MPVLILKNITAEGPGTIGDFLAARKISFTVVDLSKNEGIPDAVAFDTLVMMGGPMSVNEDDRFPYLRREEALVREFIAQGKKVFGVCLGAQIMAKALGSRVYRGKEQEIGWYDIRFTQEALRDPRIRRLAAPSGSGDPLEAIKVFHWHGETFDIPEGAVKLASSALFPNQAFRYGEGAYAFQFHIEVTKTMIYEWLRNEAVDMALITSETERFHDEYHARAVRFYESFFTDR